MADELKQDDLFGSATSGVLSDSEIEREVSRGLLISGQTFDRACLEASGYDIRVGARGVLGGEGKEIDLNHTHIELGPGSYCGVVSKEKLCLPEHIFARIGSKRALSYDGVILLTGSTVDPGYEGHLLFGLYNASQRRVIIRKGKKVCNVVFERLGKKAEKPAPSNADLLTGNFPDAFINSMANMEVLPWMQINERVKQIENITKDIIDLKARYEDVLQPIKDLTKNVNALSQDVSSLATQTRAIAKDVEEVTRNTSENSHQIAQLTSSLGTIVGTFAGIQERTGSMEQDVKAQAERVTSFGTKVDRLSWAAYILWALIILVAGFFGRELLGLLLKTME